MPYPDLVDLHLAHTRTYRALASASPGSRPLNGGKLLQSVGDGSHPLGEVYELPAKLVDTGLQLGRFSG